MTVRNPQPARRRAAVLLEIVVAVGIFTAMAMVLGGSLNAAVTAARRIERQATAANLLVTAMSELEIGLLDLADSDPAALAEQGPLANWTRAIETEPIENVDALTRVTVVLEHTPSGQTFRRSRWLADGSAGYEGVIPELPRGRGAGSDEPPEPDDDRGAGFAEEPRP